MIFFQIVADDKMEWDFPFYSKSAAILKAVVSFIFTASLMWHRSWVTFFMVARHQPKSWENFSRLSSSSLFLFLFLSLYVSWSKLNQQKKKRKEKKKEQIVEVKYSDCQRCFGNTANNHNHIWQQALCCLRSIWDEEGTAVSPMFCERYCIITFDFRCGECAF